MACARGRDERRNIASGDGAILIARFADGAYLSKILCEFAAIIIVIIMPRGVRRRSTKRSHRLSTPQRGDYRHSIPRPSGGGNDASTVSTVELFSYCAVDEASTTAPRSGWLDVSANGMAKCSCVMTLHGVGFFTSSRDGGARASIRGHASMPRVNRRAR